MSHRIEDGQVPSNRRQFVVGASAVVGGLLAGRATPAAASTREGALGAPALLRAAPDAVQEITRTDVTTFVQGSQQLTSLKAGVQAMKARSATDPTSWAAQARIHDIFCDDPPQGTAPVHYSWRFLPWHRAYLYYFEKILRAASGDSTLSLPYWNWTANLRIPQQYWGNGNPLYDATRVMTAVQQLNPQRTSIQNLMGLPAFAQFGGELGAAGALEVGPHNYVHGTIGGDMGQFSTAGKDPVFWAHHANVDRVWSMWNGQGKANPTSATWLNTSYPFYDIDQGANVNVSFAQAAALPVVYAAPPVQVVSVSDPQGVRALTGPETTPPVQLSASVLAGVLGPTAGGAALRVVGVQVPQQPVTVHVFADQPGANRGTPTTNAGFAGAFTLIPTGPKHGGHGPVDVHVALGTGFRQALLNKANTAAEAAGASVRFTLVPVASPGNAPAGSFSYDRLELLVQ